MKFSEQLKSGVILDNPVFMQTIGLCPTLATTTSLQNAIGMGAAATVVLICSNIVISAMRRIIPDKIRIAAFITIIATFVTMIDLSMQAFLPSLADRSKLHHPRPCRGVCFQEQGSAVRTRRCCNGSGLYLRSGTHGLLP